MYIFKKLKRNNSFLIIGLITAMMFSGCDAIFEKDISKGTIVIKAPVDNYESTSQEILFWWEELAGADSYHIQIVKPSFDSVASIILDTLVTGDKITVYLSQGNYQWKIRGENTAYFTEYFTRSFSIKGTEDLTQQTVNLLLPTNADTTNNPTVNFSWDAVQYATMYRIEIWSPDPNGTCLQTVAVFSPQYQYTFSEDSTFTWRVRAENDLTNTPYSARTIYIDSQQPDTPSLLYPLNSSTQTNPWITFQWDHDHSGGSSIYDSIYIATDYGFTSMLIKAPSVTETYSDSLASGIFYWRVRSYDAAGNTGSYSNIFQLIVQ
jgi:hypothetical protein